MSKPLKMIVATDANYGIGKNGDLLFHIPEDLNFFKNVTMGNVVVMGRTTFESLGSKPLKGRINIVLTSNTDLISDSTNLFFMNIKQFEHWLENNAPDDKDVFIIGGGQVYEHYIDRCDTLYITTYNKAFSNVDTYFPNIMEHGFTPATASSTLMDSGSICSQYSNKQKNYWWITKWEKSPEQYAQWLEQCCISQ